MRYVIILSALLLAGNALAETNLEPSAFEGNARAEKGLLPVAVRTIFLDVSAVSGISVPCSVAYHPGFSRYYASGTGSPDRPSFSFGPGGGVPLQVTDPLNIDCRAWNYNSNTGQLEVVSFNAQSGGTDKGLILPGTDGSGNLTGGTTTLLASMPGLNGSQTSPGYNPGADVFYSRAGSDTVNVVNRSDGSLNTTITLDFATAGVNSVPDDGTVYIPGDDLLGVVDSGDEAVVLFDLSGNYVTTLALDIDVVSNSRRPGYTNGQLFVWDGARDGWQGYQIAEQGNVTIPTLSQTGIIILVLVLGVFSIVVIRRRVAS